MTSRPTASIYGLNGKQTGQIALPMVFSAPVRPDIIQTVHTNLRKNRRQPYAVSSRAGHITAASSWGTGRAVARVPRVHGGGTQRSGQAAIGNMCRGGHMYAPTKSWRRWQRKTNTNVKRYAVASALAVSAVPSLVLSRGHKIENVPEVPLVIEEAVESISNSSNALNILKAVGAFDDVSRVAASRKIRRGKGKLRNRRYIVKKGPIIICNKDYGISRAFRNLAGVEVVNVHSLSVLKLAPGGHLGRFIIWTKPAIEAIHRLWSTLAIPSMAKKAYIIPRSAMTNSDLKRLINSDEVQSTLRPPKNTTSGKHIIIKNPLRNKSAFLKLNPYVTSKKIKKKESKIRDSKTSRHFYKKLLVDSEYQTSGCDGFRSWLGLHS